MHHFTRLARRFAIAMAFAAMPSIPTAAFAAKTWTVNTCADPATADCHASYDGSFRAAFSCAAHDDIIDLTQLQCGKIKLSSGLLNLDTTNFSVVGPGKDRLTIDLDGKGNIVHTGPHVTVAVISGLTIENGRSQKEGGCLYSYNSLRLKDVRIRNCLASPANHSSTEIMRGGGIYAKGTVHLEDSLVVGNTAGDASNHTFGGGIYAGSVIVISSTVSDNVARAFSSTNLSAGGGIAVYSCPDVCGPSTIAFSTLSGNEANQGAALFSGSEGSVGIYESTLSQNSVSTGLTGLGGTINAYIIQMYNSTVAGNTSTQGQPRGLSVAGTTPPRLSSVILADGAKGEGNAVIGDHNLLFGTASGIQFPVGTLMADPRLGPLAWNGGPTQTMLPAAESPVLGNGANQQNEVFDQRGLRRRTLDHFDIGSVERDGIFLSGFEEPHF